jgi:mannose/cellobiose epimerase-like protein (N-acyl-D-glucosamine 2-epimerase family)
MTMTTSVQDSIRAAAGRLTRWLNYTVFPLWITNGVDWKGGGFHERLDLDGHPLAEPRRSRVQPRQVYSFACAPALGWKGDVQEVCARGLRYYHETFRRPDGLAITLVDAKGAPKDSRVVAYDQAFALLAYANVIGFEGLDVDPRKAARALRKAIVSSYRHAGGGFEAEMPPIVPLQSNPHMHLFEACLAWVPLNDDAKWEALADDIGEFALQHFIDPDTGALREFFGNDWRPADGAAGRIVEPGHQYEWAWLLMRWDPTDQHGGRSAALKLIDVAEAHGLRDGFAINSMLDDFSAHDAGARLWPQTERIKAASLAARLVGGERYWRITDDATRVLERYFATPLVGLWYDKRQPNGEFVQEPAPASSLYHIVAAVAELRALTRVDS